jgi:hypothetical protein
MPASPACVTTIGTGLDAIDERPDRRSASMAGNATKKAP